MADLPPEFEGFELDTSGIDPHDINQNPKAALNGLSDWQRFAAKNLFDTQPKKRKAYLKQLGYETKTGEEIRPIGSTADFKPIEPDNAVLGFIPFWNVFSEDGRKELARDFGDVLFDLGVAGPLATAGGVAGATKVGALGAAAGSVVPGAGTAVGAGVGGTAGMITGGTAGNAAAEGIKGVIGEMILDGDIPHDMQETFYQSLTVGGLSAAGKLGGELAKKWKSMNAKQMKESMKELLKTRMGSKHSPKLVEDFMENPQNYTPEKVSKAAETLLDLQDEIFGTGVKKPKSTRQLTGGIARDKINPLNRRADLEIEKLAANPEANLTVEDIISTLRERTSKITDKNWQSTEDIKTLKYINGKLRKLKRENISPDGGFEEIDFKTAREFFKEIQNATYKEGGKMKGNEALKDVSEGLKELLDLNASSLGSDLAEINTKRADILNAYEGLNKVSSDSTMRLSTIGDDNSAKIRLNRALTHVDEVLDTNLAASLESRQGENLIKQIYNDPNNFGSGRRFSDALKEAGRQASTSAFKAGTIASAATGTLAATGAIPPSAIGTVTGLVAGGAALKGAKQGLQAGAAFSSPNTLINKVSKANSRIADLAADPTLMDKLKSGYKGIAAARVVEGSGALQDAAAIGGALMGSPQSAPQQQAQPQPQQAPEAQFSEPQEPTALPPEFDDFQLDTEWLDF